MANQPEQQTVGAIQNFGGPRGFTPPNPLGLNPFGLSGPTPNTSASALQPTSATDSFDPTGDESEGSCSTGSAQQQMQQELQQLQQEIEQLMQQLEQDSQSNNTCAANNDQAQLQQLEQELQALEGGGGGGGSMPSLGAMPDLGGGGEGDGSCAASSGSCAASSGSCAASSGSSSGQTYDGANSGVSQQTLLNNVKTVAEVAQKDGVNPTTAVATMLTESNGNNTAVGDGGTSFGLFQLHEGGELGNLSQAQADNPQTNASVALSQFASTQQSTGLTGGALAAAAQRPANPSQYAAEVNGNMGAANNLLKQAGVS